MQGTGFALENGIFWKGFFNHEPFTMQTFLQQLHSAGWFVDVGSNAGIFSLAACSMRPDVKVFAIEPMPQFFKLLQQNISLNGFNISAFQLAMSNQTGIIPIYFPHHLEGNIYSASLSLSHFKHHQSTAPNIIEVQRLRFDDLIQNYQLPGQGIIKIDAEGHGVEVLEGMRDTIQKHCPAIIIEVMSASEADQISNILKGYSYFGIMEDCCQLTGRLHIPFAPGCNNYLCLH